MFIAAMEDSHLMATIRMICRPIKALLDSISAEDQVRSRRATVLYGERRISAERARGLLGAAEEKLGPYVIEAALRSSTAQALTATLSETFGRSTRDMEGVSSVPLLESDEDPAW